MAYIEFKNISKEKLINKKSVKVLNNINFTIKKGSILVITGPSSLEKTSIIKLLGKIEKPSSGTILVDNIDINKLNNKSLNPDFFSCKVKKSLFFIENRLFFCLIVCYNIYIRYIMYKELTICHI